MDYYTGHPRHVFDDLVAHVRRYVDRPWTPAFKIGRTNDVERRERAYQQTYGPRVRLYPIYETTSVANAKRIEAALIRKFYDHPKSANIADHAGGAVAEGTYQCVYLAMGADL